ncbi:glycosyltransferase family 2 protein [Haladaptatus caseinilyticus]|uniref:glycosyltransferase family 2 protein n=1 Tax=Haladaptatus caseinilyticus TaxID=2993314 RepID=UPI00224B5D0E|nr:glycosyltransferase family 2 protein [Haladaptatus caseinilyticus]
MVQIGSLIGYIVFWPILILFALTTSFWIYEIVFLARDWKKKEIEHGLDQIQVRILTIGSEGVVQNTVDSIPDELTERIVVAEKEMTISGADVHVVPSDFSCNARYKARAVEWARRHVPCEKEYVLYLDEDTIATGLEGIPDADIVQYSEHPVRTDSYLAYLCEIFRQGFQIEQRAFSKLSIPLYAWGGGLAVRKELEDEITWNFESMIEDTRFTWIAIHYRDASFCLAKSHLYNQAPPSVGNMIRQRRRWASGTREQLSLLPNRYRILFVARNASWGASPLIPLLLLNSLFFQGITPTSFIYRFGSIVLSSFLAVWSLLGIYYYDANVKDSILLILLGPVLSSLHSVGALWGFFSPVKQFNVTEKVDPSSEKISELASDD